MAVNADERQQQVLMPRPVTESSSDSQNWATASLEELIDHIVSRHHAYVRQELPRLQRLIAEVLPAEGKLHPELGAIGSAFHGIGEEITMHLMKEEQILFPYIVDMERASRNQGPRPRAMFGTVENPVQMMMMEHDSATGTLSGMRELSSDYAVPPDASSSFRALYEGLAAFEADLEQHIHLENDILFPRAIEIETL